MKALIVDDSEINLVMAKAVLDYLGFEVQLAKSGPEAIELYKAEAYDLVLTDYQMPEMTGVELTVCLRKLEAEKKRNRCIIFAASSDETEDLSTHFTDAGADGFIKKPVTVSKFEKLLESYLKKIA